MKRLLVFAAVAAALTASLPADARLARSTCTGEIHPSGPHSCTVILAGPISATGTVPPDENGFAEIHLIVQADPRFVDGTQFVEPEILAECKASAVGEPATCTAEWLPEAGSLPTPSVFNQANGGGLPGRCIGSGSAESTFRCSGGSI